MKACSIAACVQPERTDRRQVPPPSSPSTPHRISIKDQFAGENTNYLNESESGRGGWNDGQGRGGKKTQISLIIWSPSPIVSKHKPLTWQFPRIKTRTPLKKNSQSPSSLLRHLELVSIHQSQGDQVLPSSPITTNFSFTSNPHINLISLLSFFFYFWCYSTLWISLHLRLTSDHKMERPHLSPALWSDLGGQVSMSTWLRSSVNLSIQWTGQRR